MIETERLTLRGWRDDDAAAHHAMCADPAVVAYLGPSPSLADSVAVVARQVAILADYGACFWALERRDTGAFIGWCGIKPGPVGTPIEDRPEIGWSLHVAAQGKGYASEAVRGALVWGAGHFEGRFTRTVAMIHPDNAASVAVAARCGFRHFSVARYKDAPTGLWERRFQP